MGHPEIQNGTSFAFEPVFIADEELRPVVVTVVKATYQFDAEGRVWLADEQVPVSLAGELWSDTPGSSYKYEPEIALAKPTTDIVLIGHGQLPAAAPHVDVGIRVGPVQKIARVFGDRFWVWTGQGAALSRTYPLERVPLTWENAFGGQDVPRSTPDRPLFEPRNPVGTGFGMPLRKEGDFLKLPNIEDPAQPIQVYGDVATPSGFGFTSPNWQPRAAFAGTYDDEWDRIRKPLLPADFDRRFFNAAAPGLIAPRYLQGNEEVVVLNTTAAARVAFRLPGLPPPLCRVVLRGRPDVRLPTNLDTVIVDTDRLQLLLLWRAHTLTGSGPHDVTTVEVMEGN